MPDDTKISHHILPTASNLLGLCFVILCSIKAIGLSDTTLIDEAAGAGIIFFIVPCFFSYASIRNQKRADLYEKIADIGFMLGLALIASISILLLIQMLW
ncbi:MAG: hypothetical protein WC539_02290 [Nitrospirota bacterium]